MAYTTHDGGHLGVPFLQNQFGGWGDMSMPTSFYESTDNFTQQHAILNQNEGALINSFFDDPESAMKESFSFEYPVGAQRASSENESAQLNGLHVQNQTIHNPAVTLGGNSSSQYQTQANSDRGHLTSHMNFGPEEHGQGAEDAVRAASGLFNMRMHGQENSHVLELPENANMSQWDAYGSGGGFNNVHMQDNITSPMTSSGRQSANSHHSQPQTGFMNNPFSNSIFQEQMMRQLRYQRSQQQVAQNVPRARHNSVHMDTNPFSYMTTPNAQQMQMAHSGLPYSQGRSRPSAPMRFGSDESFRTTGYHGPNSGIALEDEKQGNLINVPLAAQAAANGHAHVPYMTHQLQYSHHPVAGGAHPFPSMSTASSPGRNMGGLPLHSPPFNAANHGHPYRALAQLHVEEDNYDDSDELPAFEEEQPHKRRKSQMERDDDADYNPSGRMKAPVPKRDTKPVIMDDSGDEYQTPAKATAGKRRKSSVAAAHPYIASSNSNSPSANPSPVPKQTHASSKKKGRESERRQNLTEDQKRQNHIASEKNRRDLIKQQYDELDALVPGLKSGKSGLSRSDVLQEIVAYVESIMAGNDRMDGLLKQMGEIEVTDAPYVDGDEVV